MRRSLIALALFACSAHASTADELSSADRNDDVDQFCSFVEENYAYFDHANVDWHSVCADAKKEAENATTRNAMILVVEHALDQLHDPHAHVGSSTPASHRLVPTDADLHATMRDGRARIVDVRARSAARESGLREGQEIVAIDDVAVGAAVDARMPRHLVEADRAARDWALDVALAGLQDGKPVRVTTADGATHAFVPHRERGDGPLEARCDGDVGIVAFHNALGDSATIRAFDDALAGLSCNAGLVIDLRDVPSGGTAVVARGVIGRLIAKTMPFQRHERPSEFRDAGVRRLWVEYVEPRDPVSSRPVVVLVGHWTGSVGEGLAIGLNAAAGAPVIGRPMAGLLGALDEIRLPHSDLVARIPAERLAHVDGTPREAFVPCAAPDHAEDAETTYAVAVARSLKGPRPGRGAPHAGSCPRPARR